MGELPLISTLLCGPLKHHPDCQPLTTDERRILVEYLEDTGRRIFWKRRTRRIRLLLDRLNNCPGCCYQIHTDRRRYQQERNEELQRTSDLINQIPTLV